MVSNGHKASKILNVPLTGRVLLIRQALVWKLSLSVPRSKNSLIPVRGQRQGRHKDSNRELRSCLRNVRHNEHLVTITCPQLQSRSPQLRSYCTCESACNVDGTRAFLIVSLRHGYILTWAIGCPFHRRRARKHEALRLDPAKGRPLLLSIADFESRPEFISEHNSLRPAQQSIKQRLRKESPRGYPLPKCLSNTVVVGNIGQH